MAGGKGDGSGPPPVVAQALREVPGLLFEYVSKDFERYCVDFAGTMQRNARARLRVRTADLANSFRKFSAGNSPATWRAGVYTDSPYAARQEFGGETHATSKRYLTIPLRAATFDGSGATRGDAMLWGKAKTFFLEAKDGRLYLMLKTGKKRPPGWKKGTPDPSIEPLFLLKKRAGPIPGRLGFFRSWDDEDQIRSKIIGDAAVRALEEAGA